MLFFISGSYSRVTMQLVLTRKITYHLFRTYLPSGLFVIIGWFSLFIPLDHVPGMYNCTCIDKYFLKRNPLYFLSYYDFTQILGYFPLNGKSCNWKMLFVHWLFKETYQLLTWITLAVKFNFSVSNTFLWCLKVNQLSLLTITFLKL